MVDTLGKVVAAVAGLEGDVELAGPSETLWKCLKPFISHFEGNLQHYSDTSSDTTLEPTWDSVASAASNWQTLVDKAVGRWTELAWKAIDILKACRDAATVMGNTAAKAAEQAGDLQKKVENWLKSVGNLVTKTQQLPMATNKEKAAIALEEYRAEVGAAKQKTLEALTEVVDAVEEDSKGKAAYKVAQRAVEALGPLAGLVDVCGAATMMFKELSCRLGNIEAKVKGARETSPNVPKDLVDTVAQAERLWQASTDLAECHLLGTLGNIRELLSNGPRGLDSPRYQKVHNRCTNAKKAIPKLLERQ
ncbi:hypothetical protein TURU_001336 [Turdus rufiventris]|nr:hypothetical protein TURU_001336 [Turdus rufiventris]